MSHASASLAAPTMSLSSRVRMLAAILLVVIVSEAIGSVTFAVGPGKIVLQPMLWAIFIGAIVAAFGQRLPAGAGIDTAMQTRISGYLQYALLPFLAKLGLMVGGSLPQVREAGWALVFQEFGHFFGTMAIGLPLALLLGIKREAIGATFSVGREPSLAIIGERYGMNSPEGRGVMAEYITGTVIGALFVALMAGFITSLNIFDPRSLAMGAGVGSGSMMAAGVGAIASQQTPEVAHQVAALAAAANLLTTVVGVYFTLFISLPTTIFLYGKLEPVLGRFSRAKDEPAAAAAADTADGEVPSHSVKMGFGDRLTAYAICGLFALVGNRLGYNVPFLDALPGMAIIILLVVIADLLLRVVPKLPAVAVLSLIAMTVGCPGVLPYSDQIIAAVGKVNFLPFTTVILAMAGLSILKDLPAFRKLGWKIVVVSLAANAGTFMGATVIAEFFH
ncbi:hypothetical protein LMG3458_01199 [Achromobacter deleyi]|uniref:DUF3100 domain-containing protein n=1 Tax=Achromobacter deleyi TaxID=1353891 RepID=A0A6S7A2W0_9BURK|nr:DUF3100 domain-containing protein [Achromobacter deleyi]CAB3672998.1 hypothetical protein LMG3458_01199 [Achromobacter deleyi]CAB3835581.1 hypothetical protein LMG3481_00980 [Achromobacter deleyi]CAB3844390.1 hypothetical protein LMG3482_01437 [Achromobacter deleyi]CAB3888810.1 hypothetical protein LMG3412_03641 [Achromobacter deleyi]